MARIRTVKPDFFLDSDLCELSPLHRLFFQGLWCHADRDGRLEDKPRELKVRILPYDSCEPETMLADLAARGFIVRYAVGGQSLIQIVSFLKHQHPHFKEPPSVLPSIKVDQKEVNPCMTIHGASSIHESPAGRVGREGKGREGVVAESMNEMEVTIPDMKVSAPPSAEADTQPFKLEVVPEAEKPTRVMSRQEIFARWFETQRREALGADWVPDKRLTNVRINKELQWIEDIEGHVVMDAVHLYLADERRRKQDPPCQLLWFAMDSAEYISKAKRGAA
jgi:hypothetical protein